MAVYVELDRAMELGNAVLYEGVKRFIKHLETSHYFKAMASSLGKSAIPNIPEVVWRKKGYGLAGTAKCRENIIEMNSNYLQSPDAEKFIKNTMLHELAHILNHYYGGRNHDQQWKSICYILGDDGERCHDYRRPENAPVKKRYEVKCESCGQVLKLTAYKFNRLSKYCCGKCHGKLVKI